MLIKKKCQYCGSMFGDEVKGNCPNCGGNEWELVGFGYMFEPNISVLDSHKNNNPTINIDLKVELTKCMCEQTKNIQTNILQNVLSKSAIER